MTASASRGFVVALAVLLTCSLALGAVTPVTATDGDADEEYLVAGLGLGATIGDTVDAAGDVAGVEDEANASRNDSDLANGTINRTVDGATDDGTGTSEPTPEVTSSADATPERTPTTETTPESTPSTEQTSTPESTPVVATAEGTNGSDPVGTVGETVEAVGDGASRTVDRTATGANETVDETVNATGAGVDDTVDVSGTAVNETANASAETVAETGETVDGATNATTESVDATAESVDGATVGVTETVANTTNGGTSTVENTTDSTTDTVDDTVGTTTDGTTDATATIDRAVADVTGSVGNATVDPDLETVVDETTTAVQRTTDALTRAVGGTVAETGEVLEDVVSGSSWHDGDGGTVEAFGHPTTSSDSSATGPEGSWSGAGTDASRLGGVVLAEHDEGAADDAEGAGADGAESTGAGAGDDGGIDPGAGGAAVGAALLVGSLVATRSGMAATSTGGGGTTLLRTLLTVLREHVHRLAVLAGYSRYDFEDPLENENRAAVLETVESSPGINLTSLVGATGLSQSTVRYHLRVLEHEGLLEGAKVRGRRRYVPRTDDDVELLAAFEEESTKAVLAALVEHEPATGTTLAEALERDPSTVSHHLSRLAEAGLVEREQDGPALRNSLTPKARRAFSEVEAATSRLGYATADD